MDKSKVQFYSKTEESLNVLTHGIGLLLSIVALLFLIIKGIENDSINYVLSFSVFGASLVLLYAASTFYHYSKRPGIRARMKTVDHAAIYVLIAGTYTPFCLITLDGWIGDVIMGLVWGIALLGIIFKLFYTGRFDKLSTASYVGMGWIIVFAFVPLMREISTAGLFWLVAGGVSYTVGAFFYRQPKIKYNHAVFHVFVLVGSLCHFISIYGYV